MKNLIYHICKEIEWENALTSGLYFGSPQDLGDGFIHFSTAEQIICSAAKHRAGESGLLILTVEPDKLGQNLKWEKSRGGDLFPHLYGPLSVKAVLKSKKLKLDQDGKHIFPDIF